MTTISQECAAQSSWDRHVGQALALARGRDWTGAAVPDCGLTLLGGDADDQTAPGETHPSRRGLDPADPDWRPA